MTKKMHPKVSIVILNWNGLENTKQCLQSLEKLRYDNYEIVVVDNGSRQDSKKYLSKLKNIIYVDNPVNRGFTGGHIDGYKASTGEYIFILNNDAVVDPDCLTIALKHFEADPRVAAVGGKMFVWKNPDDAFKEGLPFYSFQKISPLTGEALTLNYDFGQVQQPNNISGAGVVLRRSILEEIGYFYERFFAYYEETDLFARMKRAGYKVLYDPSIKAWHKMGQSTKDKPYMFYHLMFRNRFICVMRHFEPAFLWRFLKNYAKVSLISMLRALRHNTPQDRAQAMAFWWNVFHIIPTLRGRWKLEKTLPLDWNRTLVREQRELISISVDCTKTIQGLDATIQSIAAQTLLSADIIILLSPQTAKNKGQLEKTYGQSVRIVIDKQQTPLSPESFATLLAKSEWLLPLHAGQTLEPEALESAVYQGVKDGAQAVFFSQAFGPTTSESLEKLKQKQETVHCVMRKEAAIELGGYENTASASLQFAGRLLAYRCQLSFVPAELFHDIDTQKTRLNEKQYTALVEIYKKRKTLHKKNNRLLTPYYLFLNKHRRFQQLITGFKWLGNPHVGMRQKLGRSKSLLLGLLTLNKSQVKEQLLHIKNEYYFATNDLPDDGPVLPKNPKDTLVFIISRDRLKPLTELLRWLKAAGLHRIVIVDNQSTYPPLVEFYKKTDYQVIPLDQNPGHTSPWTSGTAQLMASNEYYILTDPDVIPAKSCPADVLDYLYGVLQRFPHHIKVGLGLRIDDLPDNYALRQPVIEWEQQFWRTQLAPDIYESGVDTTFALYRPRTKYSLHPSLRTGGKYVAQHLPWYVDSLQAEEDEEELYYRQHASAEINSWNRDSIPERYQKELIKQRKGKR